MKKLLSCILSFCLLIGCLCGCADIFNELGLGDGSTESSGEEETGKIVLEDFAELGSYYRIAEGGSFKTEDTKGGHLDSLTDKNGVTAEGVGYAKILSSWNVMVVRFNRTEAQLQELYDQIDTLTVRVLIKRGTDSTYPLKIFGASQSLETNTWTDFTVTKEDVRSVVAGEAMKNEVSEKVQFATNFHSKGLANAPRMITGTTNGVDIEVYIDSITYTLVADI